MKIAFLGKKFDESGGAEISLLTLYENLSKEHNCHIFSQDKEETSPSKILRRIIDSEYFPYSRLVLEIIHTLLRHKSDFEDFDPDLVFSQHESSSLTLFHEESKKVHFIRDYSYLPSEAKGRTLLTKSINKVLCKINNRIKKKIISQQDLVIANSDYVGKKYEEYYPIQTFTVYPFVDFANYKTHSEGEYILHINPSKSKGINITLKIAKELKDQNFLIAGSEPSSNIMNSIKELDNVHFVGYVDNMRKIYRKTKIVLVPSVWEEPLGRIPIESGISGIPAISSGNGGLSESTPQPLIVSQNKPEEYIQKIDEVGRNYEKFSEISRIHAQKFKVESQFSKLTKLLKDKGLEIEISK